MDPTATVVEAMAEKLSRAGEASEAFELEEAARCRGQVSLN